MIKKSKIKQTNNNNTVKYIQNNTVKLVSLKVTINLLK